MFTKPEFQHKKCLEFMLLISRGNEKTQANCWIDVYCSKSKRLGKLKLKGLE